MSGARWLLIRGWLDRAVAVVAGLALSPLAAAVAVAVRRSSPGPVLVRLARVGRGGRVFSLHKFRSMRVDSVDGSAGGSALTVAGDDRITPVGHLLRRTRIDELPNLWDVVRGEMALIGPRPEARQFVDPDDPAWAEVLTVRPGIAGATQLVAHRWEEGLSGADEYVEVILPAKLAVDRWYLQVASPIVDLRIVAAVLRSVAGGRSGGRLEERIRAEVPEVAVVDAHVARR